MAKRGNPYHKAKGSPSGTGGQFTSSDDTWYHGSISKFSEFKPDSWFTNDPVEAGRYAEIKARYSDHAEAHVYAVKLAKDANFASQQDYDKAEKRAGHGGYVSTKDVFAELKKGGFSGFKDKGTAVVFDPTKIKSK
jgi:hypothetical protein